MSGSSPTSRARPFACITYHHVPARRYRVRFAAGIVGIMVPNLLNSRLALRFGGDRLLLWGTGAAALPGVVRAIAA